MCVCVLVWACNQVNAFTKPLGIFSKYIYIEEEEALTTLLLLIQHAYVLYLCLRLCGRVGGWVVGGVGGCLALPCLPQGCQRAN